VLTATPLRSTSVPGATSEMSPSSIANEATRRMASISAAPIVATRIAATAAAIDAHAHTTRPNLANQTASEVRDLHLQ